MASSALFVESTLMATRRLRSEFVLPVSLCYQALEKCLGVWLSVAVRVWLLAAVCVCVAAGSGLSVWLLAEV
eukprot:354542-Chlamydomonas_euryale.AAC.2